MTSIQHQSTAVGGRGLANSPTGIWTLGEDLLVYVCAAAGSALACASQAHECLAHLPGVRSAGVAGRRVLDAPGVFSDLGTGCAPFEARPGGRALLDHCRRHARDPLADGCGLVLLCDGEPIGHGTVHEHTRAAQRAVGEHGWWLNIVDGSEIRWDMDAAMHILNKAVIREHERVQRAALVRRRWGR